MDTGGQVVEVMASVVSDPAGNQEVEEHAGMALAQDSI
jgi:hypothetical protein